MELRVGSIRALRAEGVQAPFEIREWAKLVPSTSNAKKERFLTGQAGNIRSITQTPPLAAGDCIKALQINPQLPEAYCNLGNIRFQQDDFEEAVINYQKALSLRPSWAQAQENLSIAKSRMQTP